MRQLLCVSQDWKSVACLAKTGKAAEVKVWDVPTNKLEMTFSCQEEKVTSLAFCHAGSKKRKQEAPSFIISGTESGAILVFDIKSGQNVDLKFSLSSSVTSIHYCSDSGVLLVGTKKGQVKALLLDLNGTISEERTIKTEFKTPITSLASWGSIVAIGQDSVSLYNMDTQSIVKTLTGHSSGNVTLMSFFEGHLATASDQDPSILIWDVDSDREDPIFTAVLPQPPKMLNMIGSTLSALYENKCVFFDGVNAEAKKKIVSLKSKSDFSFSSETLLAVYQNSRDQLLTVRGTLVLPVFETISLWTAEGQFLSGVLERESVMVGSKAHDDKKENKKKKARVTPEVISGASAPIRHIPDGSLQESAVMEDAVVVNGEDGLKTVTNLLVQALQSRNPQLIESALGLNDEVMIIESLEKLPESISIVLLEELVKRISKSPARVVQLGPWIRCLHNLHGKHLRSLKNYNAIMRPLQDTIAIHTESEDLIPALAKSLKEAMAKRAHFEEDGNGKLSVQKSDNYLEYVDETDEEESDGDDEIVPDIVEYGHPIEQLAVSDNDSDDN